jgi:exodeoxyribonuclease V alpha subunit
MPTPSPTGASFSGEVLVRSRRFVDADTGFAVLDCTSGDDRLTLVGPIAHLEEDERADVSGQWGRDPRYGPQVRVHSALPLPPSGRDAVLDYLRRTKHIGERRAQRLLDLHGTAVLEVVDRDPAEAFRELGLSPRRSAEAAATWDALRATRELHLLLAPHGLAYLVARIHREYGDGAHRAVRNEPYGLTSVFGVGFQIADRIARGLGVDADDPERRRAAILHVLAVAERDGSTCLPRGQLLPGAAELLGLDGVAPAVVDELASQGDLVVLDGDWVYRRETAELEAELAERVGALLAGEPAARLRQVRASASDAPGHGTELTHEQWAGVQSAFARRLSIITGGPGTGKTASIRTIVAVAEEHDLRVVLAAPTGRAAVRMSHATGVDATTVHSALGWVPGSGPSRDEDFPLECDVLTIDETSMANLELLVTLLRAVGPATNVVLVGDADQLAPVGAGKPFADLVATAAVPTAKLEHIFRQAAGSMIVQGAHRVRRGLAPSFAAADGMQRDLYLIECADPVAARKTVVDLVSERLPSHFGVDPVDDIQVFAPIYAGELGINALNADLREALNPTGKKAVGAFRLGDKLMLSGRNLHELGLMNGTLMRLLETWTDDDDGKGTLHVRAEDTTFDISDDELGHLRLAYACSVHKGQGIELPIAVLVAHPAAGGRFLRREMLYTAMTRATHATVIVGDRSVVERAVRSADTVRRHSRFPQRIQDLVAGARE